VGDEVEDDDAEEDEGEDDCAEDEVEDDDVADGQVEDDDVEDDDVEEEEEEEEEEEDRSPDCDPQFVRACAVEIHMGKTHEPFHAEIGKKNAAPDVQHKFCASLPSRNARGQNTRAILGTNLRENAAPQTLCEPAPLKCTWTKHKSHFTRNFTRKMPGPRLVSTSIKHRP